MQRFLLFLFIVIRVGALGCLKENDSFLLHDIKVGIFWPDSLISDSMIELDIDTFPSNCGIKLSDLTGGGVSPSKSFPRAQICCKLECQNSC